VIASYVPNDAEAYNKRGFARSALGDKQGAINDFNRALKIAPNFAYAYYNRENARYRLGDKQGAINTPMLSRLEVKYLVNILS